MKFTGLKSPLNRVKPLVWRQLEVPADIPLDRLENIIQIAMGWEGHHLSNFTFNDIEYSSSEDEDMDMYGEPMEEYNLNDCLTAVGQKGLYTYDFGDNWEHEILLEKILSSEAGVKYPRCIAGKRACSPEDCGGSWSYMDLLRTLENPKHPEYKEILSWVGEDFDPEAFDLDEVNKYLAGN